MSQPLPHVTPKSFYLSASSSKMQLPETQARRPSVPPLGLVGCLAHSGGCEGRGRVGGGWGRERMGASRLLINANKYANGESRNALLGIQFNPSNPGGKSL